MTKEFDQKWWDDLNTPNNGFEKVAKGFATGTPSGTLPIIYVTGTSKGAYSPAKDNYERCYHKHPVLSLGSGLVIYGGSCYSPAVKDADVYIGFDGGMTETSRRFPWTKGYEIRFPITDGSVPKDFDQFTQLIAWTYEKLTEGAKVHCGCIGGHGRTGLFLSALVCTMMDKKDAISYVRENYCKKAVESTEQVAWLSKHFGITAVEGSKAGLYSSKTYSSTKPKDKPTAFLANAIRGASCMWGKKAI